MGKAFQENGHEVLWASEGRSVQTQIRATKAGFRDVGTAEAMAQEADAILAIHDGAGVFAVYQIDTPEEVVKFPVAESVITAGFRGLYIDANTIIQTPDGPNIGYTIPREAQWEDAMGEYVTSSGATYTGAAVYGFPPSQKAQGEYPHRTRTDPGSRRTEGLVRYLYVDGDHAQRVVDMLSVPNEGKTIPLIAEVVDPEVGAKGHKRRLMYDNIPPNPEQYSRIDNAWVDAYG